MRLARLLHLEPLGRPPQHKYAARLGCSYVSACVLVRHQGPWHQASDALAQSCPLQQVPRLKVIAPHRPVHPRRHTQLRCPTRHQGGHRPTVVRSQSAGDQAGREGPGSLGGQLCHVRAAVAILEHPHAVAPTQRADADVCTHKSLQRGVHWEVAPHTRAATPTTPCRTVKARSQYGCSVATIA